MHQPFEDSGCRLPVFPSSLLIPRFPSSLSPFCVLAAQTQSALNTPPLARVKLTPYNDINQTKGIMI